MVYDALPCSTLPPKFQTPSVVLQMILRTLPCLVWMCRLGAIYGLNFEEFGI